MSKSIKKLVAKERIIEETTSFTFAAGFKWVFLVDPETGKIYEPNPGWEVTGDNLEEMFRELSDVASDNE